jgi:hypothetical protein
MAKVEEKSSTTFPFSLSRFSQFSQRFFFYLFVWELQKRSKILFSFFFSGFSQKKNSLFSSTLPMAIEN